MAHQAGLDDAGPKADLFLTEEEMTLLSVRLSAVSWLRRVALCGGVEVHAVANDCAAPQISRTHFMRTPADIMRAGVQ
jgi:hypothetical protein